MNDTECPRLIEIALPIREISAESVRQKSAQRGHISTLHVWWARRPIPASRAVVFASLVPDPDDPRCPPSFKDAVDRLLRTAVPTELQQRRSGRRWIPDPDPYAPYGSIDDSLRNRLLAFIAKWSPEYLEFQAGRTGTPPKPAHLLDDRSLVKWEASDPANAQGRAVLRIAEQLVRASHPDSEPVVLDPFAGGGAIPLEASRLGCFAIGNDYDPVAYLILRATCEYPQAFGKPAARLVSVSALGHELTDDRQVDNALAFDFEKWARWVIDQTRSELCELYTTSSRNELLGYYWVRVVSCANPSCGGEIPLLRNLLLCKKDGKRVALRLLLDENRRTVSFDIVRNDAIRSTEGPKRQRGSAVCPHCMQPNTEANLRAAAVAKRLTERLVVVIEQAENGDKLYRLADDRDLAAFEAALSRQVEVPQEYIVPEVNSPTASPRAGSHRSINLELYGITRWGQLFNHRQLVLMNTLVRRVREAIHSIERETRDDAYAKALATYLGLWLSRSSARYCAATIWHIQEEKFEHPFGRQSVPMTWDYPEVNPFTAGSAGLSSSLEQMLRVIRRESGHAGSVKALLGSADSMRLDDGSVDCVITDPPYGNSIAYADLADYFYVWLKRTLGDTLPDVFVTPQTPKEKEATSHKHRHEGSQQRANTHYELLLGDSFREAIRVTRPPQLLVVMFAHQTTDAWSALLKALHAAGFSPDATWPIDTELTTALKGGLSALASSVTVVCRPRVIGAAESCEYV
jgi:putative DNA methylase